MEPVVIVGTGLAGYATAREFRKHDRETPLLMVTADGGASYSKPTLSTAMSRGKSAEALVQMEVERMAEQVQAEICVQQPVQAIDAEDRRLHLADGSTVTAASIVLAIGAEQIDPGLDGDAAGEVFAVNDLTTYAGVRRALADAERVVIIGGGLIGCEFANDWAGAGYQVRILEPLDYPLGRMLPPLAGEELAARLRAAGVDIRTGHAAAAVERGPDGYRVVDDGGGTHAADVVVRAIGLRPRTALAAAAGLTTARGIVTDRWLETSAAGIFALGDCAEVDGLFLPFIMPINHCARALGPTLACDPTKVDYPVMPVIVKTPACPVQCYPPPPGLAGEWEEERVAGGTRSLFRDTGGDARGYALTGSAVADKAEFVRQVPPAFANRDQ